MASSSNRKSNSSASSTSKPTFRRASGTKAPRRISAQSSRGAAKRTASARPGSSHAPQISKQAIRSYATPSKKTRRSNASTSQRLGRSRAAAPRAQRCPAPSERSAGRQRPGAMRRTTFWPRRRADAAERPAGSPARSAKRPASAAGTARAQAERAHRRPRSSAEPPRRRHRGRLLLALTVSALLIVAVGSALIINSGLFEATDVIVHGSAHVEEQQARKLIRVPDGSTLLNLNEDAISARILKNPWVDRVDIERQFPHRLIITPHERTILAIAYISADDIAWAIDSDDTWIAPVTLSVRVDGEGAIVSGGASAKMGASAGDATELTGLDAAAALARQAGSVLLTGVSADVKPASGMKVSSSIVLAGLSYARGFSSAFLKQIKNIELGSSQNGISANLSSGVEVMLGKPADIRTKEQVVVRILQQRKVTYVNVSNPDNATFRGAPDV